MTLPERIETERLVLRPYAFSDAADVFAYASTPGWNQFLPVPIPYLPHHAEEFIAMSILKDRSVKMSWAIEFEGQVIGGLDFNLVSNNQEVAEFHWSVGQPHWGKGIMSEAGRAIRDLGFRSIGNLHRIQSFCDVANIGSWRVMEKIGMSREGMKRQSLFIQDNWADAYWYAILRSEWESLMSEAGEES